MIIGLVSLLVLVTLAIFVALTRSSVHDVSGDEEVFRYKKSNLTALLICAPAFALLSFCTYVLAHPRPTGTALYPYLLAGILPTVGATFLYIYMRSFSIVAVESGLRITRFSRETFVGYKDIKKLTLVQGGKGGMTLSAFDAGERRIFTLSDSFEDVPGLCGLIRARADKFGLVYRHRDRWGKWT
ncbi:hypothetical protein [Dyella mobilis]|uniref:PH domain-containing protein n=1 Tax=Dyella mobilis TaxID=1849582 RepID=A0ABS2KEI4_9GAMM|nr:hypothetical protein [Dyella mobilis]MBM7129585.1 hypothetical protein [Dyella mobilis]GLQ98151.1 hypothetical protein GCM10007863_25710 [Dyella mobilis]